MNSAHRNWLHCCIYLTICGWLALSTQGVTLYAGHAAATPPGMPTCESEECPLAYLLQNLAEGDQILASPGTYQLGTLTATKNFRLEALSGPVVIKFTGAFVLQAPNSGTTTLKNITLQNDFSVRFSNVKVSLENLQFTGRRFSFAQAQATLVRCSGNAGLGLDLSSVSVQGPSFSGITMDDSLGLFSLVASSLTLAGADIGGSNLAALATTEGQSTIVIDGDSHLHNNIVSSSAFIAVSAESTLSLCSDVRESQYNPWFADVLGKMHVFATGANEPEFATNIGGLARVSGELRVSAIGLYRNGKQGAATSLIVMDAGAVVSFAGAITNNNTFRAMIEIAGSAPAPSFALTLTDGSRFNNGDKSVFYEHPEAFYPKTQNQLSSGTTTMSTKPWKLIFEALVYNISQHGEDDSFNINFQVADYFGNIVPLVTCKSASVCYQADEILTTSGGNTLTCTSSTLMQLKVSTAPTTVGEFHVRFGPEFCSSPSAWTLADPTPYDIKIKFSTPTSMTIVIVICVIVVVAAISVAVAVYLRARRRRFTRIGGGEMHKPLITTEGLMLTEAISTLLKEACVPIVDPDDVELQETIGSGSTGVVVLGKWLSRNEMKVAIKQLSTASVTNDGWQETRREQMQALVTELQNMANFSHPNLLPLLGCCVIGANDIRLITPYMSNKSLAEHITTLDQNRVLPILNEIAFAMEYLETKNIVHRDLSPSSARQLIDPANLTDQQEPENVLLSQDFHAKVADFALSKNLNVTMTLAVVGTPAYMAPELIDSGEASSAADCYSFGVICIELMSRKRLFTNMRPMTIMYKVANNELNPDFPEEFKNDATRPLWAPKALVELVLLCISRDPTQRPSFKRICDTLKTFSN